jgi:type IV fimbrial biogenesis protein FimT
VKRKLPQTQAMHYFSKSVKAHGMTLVELMITLAVAAILISVAVPSFNTMIRNHRLSTQANEMIAAIHLARSEAVKRNINVSFCRAASDTATVCSNGDSTDNWTNWIILAGGNVIRRNAINSHGGSLLVRSDLTSNTLILSPEGLSYAGGSLASNQQISVCVTNSSNNNRRIISMSAGNRLSTTTESGTCP